MLHPIHQHSHQLVFDTRHNVNTAAAVVSIPLFQADYLHPW
jgi:hypothetical protein